MTTYATTTRLLSDDGQTRERLTFYVTRDAGGYVRYQDRHGRERQLCARFRTMGETLYCTGTALKSTIQRAMRQARQDEVTR